MLLVHTIKLREDWETCWGQLDWNIRYLYSEGKESPVCRFSSSYICIMLCQSTWLDVTDQATKETTDWGQTICLWWDWSSPAQCWLCWLEDKYQTTASHSGRKAVVSDESVQSREKMENNSWVQKYRNVATRSDSLGHPLANTLFHF